MTRVEKLRDQIREDWGAESLALRLFNGLASLPPGNTNFITPTIAQGLCSGLEPEFALRLLDYFSGDRLGLLRIAFAVWDENEQALLELDVQSIKAFAGRRVPVIHPDTGEPIENPEDDVVVYYVGTPLLNSIVGAT